MKVAIAKVFRMSKKDLQKKCIELIRKKADLIEGDYDTVKGELAECIGEDSAELLDLAYQENPDEELIKDIDDEEIRIILKHLGGFLIAEGISTDGVISEVDLMESFDDCKCETFVHFLK